VSLHQDKGSCNYVIIFVRGLTVDFQIS